VIERIRPQNLMSKSNSTSKSKSKSNSMASAPAARRALFGEPKLLLGEDPADYTGASDKWMNCFSLLSRHDAAKIVCIFIDGFMVLLPSGVSSAAAARHEISFTRKRRAGIHRQH